MSCKRLKLDWTLSTTEERSTFLNNYMNEITFIPNPEELEMMASYVLWGRDSDGKNAVQRHEIELETRNKTWARNQNVESLDALLESPTFNEATLNRENELPTRVRREVFDREKALNECPPSMRPTFESLFAQIDELDLTINFYDLEHGKRKTPPREELLKKFDTAAQLQLRERASRWTQFRYLKNRHLLVELRREQFTLRDAFVNTIRRETLPELIIPEAPPKFSLDIPVFPVGVFSDSKLASLLFRDSERLHPAAFSEDELTQISKFIWKKENEFNSTKDIPAFDFRNIEHVYELFYQVQDLEDDNIDETTKFLLKTLNFYVDRADLSEAQRFILDLKVKKFKNQDIADIVNRKFQKSYTANYISTIFRQKIIPKINEEAIAHLEILHSLFFEEEFKKCTCCGQWKLRNADNWVKKARSKDGFANRCKRCDRKLRQEKK